jgi:NADH:ubiquinone oxidoreductase subunit F (NADH-binding)/NADH:ubiquinone oxidoreductase subunit E
VFDELRAIQSEHGYLPPHELRCLSEKLKIPVSQIHAVASFYPHFHLKPRPRVEVLICDDMTCHIRGSAAVRSSIGQTFGAYGEDQVTIRPTSCLGRCDTAPAIALNDRIFSGLTPSAAVELMLVASEGKPLPPRVHPRTGQKLTVDPYAVGQRTYKAVRHLLESKDVASTIATLKASGLRGMGGAGFPTAMKWEIVRSQPSCDKYIVCNADESEPGTIKDRFIMENAPHLVVEGMIVAGLVTGAKQGILYIRHEYEEQQEVLQGEIERCYGNGVLGKSLFGTGVAFDLRIFVSPGGYICGEESALLEAIEGKRAEPRNKPPFPGTNGLWDKPTVINNVETFTFATAILVNGVDWFKQQGINGVAGLKFVGISGDVLKPGVFEVPMGTSYRDLIYRYAGGISEGRTLLGFAPSGPSSGYLPASSVDLPLDFNALAAAGSMVGSGAIVVCAEGRCMLDMALNAVRFFRNESCGKCVPCRIGSQKLVDVLTRWTQGSPERGDTQLIEELMKAMRLTSICGLGQIVHAPLASVMKHFPTVIDEHLRAKHCPGNVCFSEMKGE